MAVLGEGERWRVLLGGWGVGLAAEPNHSSRSFSWVASSRCTASLLLGEIGDISEGVGDVVVGVWDLGGVMGIMGNGGSGLIGVGLLGDSVS